MFSDQATDDTTVQNQTSLAWLLYQRLLTGDTMADIESLEFPKITFSEALEILGKIRAKNIKTIQSLMTELGYSPTSHGGSFFYKWAALSRFYGLLEPSRASLSFTRLGERIVDSLTESDKAAAMKESLNRVDLLKSLFESLGSDYHQDDFKVSLSRITNASPAEVAKVAKRMEEIYQDASKYMRSGIGPKALSPAGGTVPKVAPGPSSVSGYEAEAVGSIGIPRFSGPVRNLHSEDGYFIRIVLNETVIDEAIGVLTALKARAASKRPLPAQSTLDTPSAG